MKSIMINTNKQLFNIKKKTQGNNECVFRETQNSKARRQLDEDTQINDSIGKCHLSEEKNESPGFTA